MHWIVILLLLITAAAPAQEKAGGSRKRMVFPTGQQTPHSSPAPEKQSDPGEIIAAFFLALKAEQVDAAYETLVKNTIISEKRENVDELKKRTTQALDSYGPISGYEIVDRLEIGSSLLRYTCLSLNADLPLRWRFYFYRTSNGGWKLVDLRVDDALVELFDEMSHNKKK